MKRYMIHCQQIDVRVTEWGNPNHPVIFCLHGLGSTALSFIEIAEQLKSSYRIISIDAPGHGMTQPFENERDYDFGPLTDWLDDLLTQLDVKMFYFLSHSWGSFVHLYYLTSRGHRVLGSIMLDGGYQSKRLRELTAESEAAFYETDFEGFCESWEQFEVVAVYDGITKRSPLLDLAAQDLALLRDHRYYWHARGKTGAAIIRSMHRDDILDFAHEAKSHPIVLFRATLPESDEPFKEHAIRQFRQLTGATVKAVPSATHMFHWNDPEVVVDEIKRTWSVHT